MSKFIIHLNFSIDYGRVDPTPDQTPPGTPEEFGELDANLLVQCTKEEQPGPTRYYHVEQLVEADSDDGLMTALEERFIHLPEFVVHGSSVDPLDEGTMPVGDEACMVHQVVCHFRSGVPSFRLFQQFGKNVACGVMLNYPDQPTQYVALVLIEAPFADGLPETVESLLRKAFEADSEESAINFTAIKTSVIL